MLSFDYFGKLDLIVVGKHLLEKQTKVEAEKRKGGYQSFFSMKTRPCSSSVSSKPNSCATWRT